MGKEVLMFGDIDIEKRKISYGNIEDYYKYFYTISINTLLVTCIMTIKLSYKTSLVIKQVLM